MAHDLQSQFYTSLNFPLHEKLQELTKIIDQFGPNKELQSLFPELINNIFATSFSNGWGLKTITMESNQHDYEMLIQFLHPQGPIFRLCYKLLADPQLKYALPLSSLPLDLQMSIERGRYPQFYADLLATDPQTMNVTALMLNPFDYYMFNFALHVVNNNQNRISWDNWNSVYFALACDYLLHFLPVDPNEPVLPHIPNYTGKVPMAAPLQTANRPYSPSMLLIQDLSGAMMSNQHATQTQSRNEVWRSETVLQVFIDVWMSVEQLNGQNNNMYQRSYPVQFSSPERVRTVRVLIKHLHAFSARHLSDPAVRSSALRKYARQVMCARAYHYIKHLVTTWPLDASFRLVLELWLSYIQPWRYVDNSILKDRFSKGYQEEHQTSTSPLDAGFTQFIAENFPSYVCIFQMVLPRFVRLDLTSYKNTVMLFRLGKVFAQPHLVPILKNLEQAIVDSGSGLHSNPDSSFNNSGYENYTYNGLSLQKWAAIAKQSLSEFNLSANFEYQPLWSDSTRQFAVEFVQKIHNAIATATKNAEEFTRKVNSQNSGIWSSIKHWLMISGSEDDALLEEYRKVAPFLNTTVRYFSTIFGLNESTLHADSIVEESLENSSFANSSTFPHSVTNRLRSTASVHYMGDPDLMPITTYESTILVRMLYQIASRINESYQTQFTNLWDRNDLWGYVAREVLQKPCRIQTYVKDVANYQNVVTQELPARLSLRRLGSHAFVVWFAVGYILFRMMSYSGFSYVLVLVALWMAYVIIKASLKMMKIVT